MFLPHASFASTQWSMVAQAADPHSPEAKHALASLCKAYRKPLYSYIRQLVNSAADADDLTNDFFVYFLERNLAATADPAKGKFRAFLRKCCRNFVLNRLKRTKNEPSIGHMEFEPAVDNTPERIFDRECALMVLGQVMTVLEGEYHAAGNADLFAQLKPVLVADPDAQGYREIAATVDKSENAIKKAVQQSRKRFRELIRESVSATVTSPDQVEDEIRDLLAALSAR